MRSTWVVLSAALITFPVLGQVREAVEHIGASVLAVHTAVHACRTHNESGESGSDVESLLKEWMNDNAAEVNALRVFHSAMAQSITGREGAEAAAKFKALSLSSYRSSARERQARMLGTSVQPTKDSCAKLFSDIRSGQHRVSRTTAHQEAHDKFTTRFNMPPKPGRSLNYDILPELIQQ